MLSSDDHSLNKKITCPWTRTRARITRSHIIVLLWSRSAMLSILYLERHTLWAQRYIIYDGCTRITRIAVMGAPRKPYALSNEHGNVISIILSVMRSMVYYNIIMIICIQWRRTCTICASDDNINIFVTLFDKHISCFSIRVNTASGDLSRPWRELFAQPIPATTYASCVYTINYA